MKIKTNKIIPAFVALGIATLFSVFILAGFGDGWNQKFTDTLYNRNSPSKDIVIIAIDDKSTVPEPFGLGRYTQWGRDKYALLLEKITPFEPKVITFDIIYNNPTQNISIQKIKNLKSDLEKKSIQDKIKIINKFLSSNSNPYNTEEDKYFAAQIEKAGNVILAMAGNESQQILPIKRLFLAAEDLGHAIGNPDIDGITRRLALKYFDKQGNKIYKSLALKSAELFLNRKIDISDIPQKDNKFLVNYFTDPFEYKMVSFIDVLEGAVPTETFSNKIVLVGVTSFKEIHDKALTPRSNEFPMPGVELHANAIQTILDQKFLERQSATSSILTIFGIAILFVFAFSLLNISWSTVLLAASLLLYLGMAHFFYRLGVLLNMVYPFLVIIFSYIAAWVYRYFIADRSKREITSAFGHYVSTDLVKEISKNPDAVKLGGERRVVTVFFSDIKDSTTLSEKILIEQWVSQINEYFTAMEIVMKQFGGTIDKFEGDAIMGFWNAPISQPDHIERAYVTAIEMKKVLARMHQKWRQEGKPLLEIRIGINTGEAIVGNFGSRDRFDYTAMGDTVNTASRLESSANKNYGTGIIVAGAFELGDTSMPGSGSGLQKFTFREIDTVLLPGKNESLRLFELIGFAAELSDTLREIITNYKNGLTAYRSRNFQQAYDFFRQNQNSDPPSQVMALRCEKLLRDLIVPELDEKLIYRIVSK